MRNAIEMKRIMEIKENFNKLKQEEKSLNIYKKYYVILNMRC